MPRRGRHRTSLPLRLIGVVTALLLIGGGVAVAGSALADDDGDGVLSSLSSKSGKDSDDSGDSGDSDEDSEDSDEKSDDEKSEKEKGEDREDEEKKAKGGQNGDDEGNKPDEAQKDKGDKGDEEEFPGRDEIARADADEYVDITEVDENGGNRGDGGVFGGGSYTVDCGVSDHNNSDNYMAAPGKRNGAQHVHDYVGNTTTNNESDHGSLEDGGTSCGNGDKSTFFWPVLRDLNGRGPDVGEDGGSLDGNVGAILKPASAQLAFHGHPGQDTEPLPQGLMMIMGNAKAKKQDGDNANSKYTCTGFENRVTDKYPICPAGSQLKRMLDYPSCWDGKNLESKDFRSHIFYPNGNGQCDDDETPIPQLRITLTYDQPAGRAFQIDSFPDNQHDPTTDHSDYENVATEEQNEAGAECINAGRRCNT